LWSETGQRLGLIFKGRDNVCYADNPQHILHSTTRTEQFQATTLTAERNIRGNDGADAHTIQLPGAAIPLRFLAKGADLEPPRAKHRSQTTFTFNTYENTGSAHLPSQSHLATKTSPRCFYSCTMAIGADAPTHQLIGSPSCFHESTEVIPAALQERGERQEHETQL